MMEPTAAVAVAPTSAQNASMHPSSLSALAHEAAASSVSPVSPCPSAHPGNNSLGMSHMNGNSNNMEGVGDGTAARSNSPTMPEHAAVPQPHGTPNTNTGNTENSTEGGASKNSATGAHGHGNHMVGSTNQAHDLPVPGAVSVTVPGGDGPGDINMAVNMNGNNNMNMNMSAVNNMNVSNMNNMEAAKEKRGRRLQHVSTLRDRYEVIMWMREQERQRVKNVPLRAIDVFPQFFQATHPANRMKAQRWWQQRHRDDLSDLTKVDVVSGRPRTKARAGRGRKSPAWVVALLNELKDATELNLSTSIIDTKNVRTVATRILNEKAHKYPHCDNKTLARVVRKYLKTRGADGENLNGSATHGHGTMPMPMPMPVSLPVPVPPPPSTSASVPAAPVEATVVMAPAGNEHTAVETLHGLPSLTPVTLADPLHPASHPHPIPSMPSAGTGTASNGNVNNMNENATANENENEGGTTVPHGLLPTVAEEVPMDTGQATKSGSTVTPMATTGSE